ncbi:MAG: FkbM family methyltransferase [Chloroflexota bacterium]
MAKQLLSLASFAARVLPSPVKRLIYRLGPLAAFIRRSLNRAAPIVRTPVTIAAGDLAGLRLTLYMQTEKDYWLGTYEPDLQAALRKLARPGMVAYDVGANIGYISLLLAQRLGKTGQVFAFEALPENLTRLDENITQNGFDDRVTIVAAAVTHVSGPTRFLMHTSGGMGKAVGSSGRLDETYPAEVAVPGLSLDDFVYQLGNPAPDLIKMDIEGGEVLALPGMKRVLAEARPWLLMELHGPESARAAWDALTEAGYTICWMKRGFPQVPSLEELDWKAYLVGRPAG